jgi:hypothetical protein
MDMDMDDVVSCVRVVPRRNKRGKHEHLATTCADC